MTTQNRFEGTENVIGSRLMVDSCSREVVPPAWNDEKRYFLHSCSLTILVTLKIVQSKYMSTSDPMDDREEMPVSTGSDSCDPMDDADKMSVSTGSDSDLMDDSDEMEVADPMDNVVESFGNKMAMHRAFSIYQCGLLY
jgi:hypothetical protein